MPRPSPNGCPGKRAPVKRFRLPTEAEWEYAARAGTATRYHWGNDIDPRYANFSDRNDPTGASIATLDDGQAVTAPVGTYQPNALGLRDMAGNVWEWTCSDYDPAYTGKEQRCSSQRPPKVLRVVRGGSWNNGAGDLRSAKRMPGNPAIAMRQPASGSSWKSKTIVHSLPQELRRFTTKVALPPPPPCPPRYRSCS